MAKPVDNGHVTPLSNKDPQLIITDTTARNLHAIALALSIGAPTLLEGVTGAGKTTLVEELAIRTGRGDRKYTYKKGPMLHFDYVLTFYYYYYYSYL